MTSLRTTIMVIACVLLLLSGAATFVDPDTWHSMALARETLAAGSVPLADDFAYTPTVFPVVHHEWGTGMLLYFLAMHGGIVAFQVARCILIAVIGFGAVRVARARGATPSVLAILAVPASIMGWIGLTAIRSQLITLAFLSVWLQLIESDRRGSRRWLFVALAGHLVWLNMHGGFVVGMAVLALHGVEQAFRRQPSAHVAAVVCAMGVLVAVNPYGFSYYAYLAHALTMTRSLIGEWGPIWHARLFGFAVYLATIAIAIGAMAHVSITRVAGWPILAAMAYLAASHERHVSMYALVWFAYVPGVVALTPAASILQRLWTSPSSPVAVSTGLTALAVSTCLFFTHHPWRLMVSGTTADGAPAPYPVGPVAYLGDAGIKANLIVPFGAGAFVSWKLHPNVKVSIDSRYETAFPPDLLVAHLKFFAARPGWRDFLSAYPTDLVLAPANAPIVAVMATESAWTVVYRDDAYTLFARPGLMLEEIDRRGQRIVGTFP